MVDLVALTATHDAVEAPAVDFDWYVPVTVTWPKRQRLLEPPVYRQISWHSGLLELKFHPHDNDLVEAVLIFPDQVDIEDHALAPAPIDPNPSLICRLRQKNGAGGADFLHVTAHLDYLCVRFSTKVVVTWLGTDPVLFGQSFGGMVALGTAIRHPELPGKLIVSSSAAKIRLDRALPMFERLGGKEARDLAQRLFEDPNQENFDAYLATCLPLYNTTKADPDILARVRLKPEVGFHFFRGEGLTFDWLADLDRIRCPTLILAGEVDPITPVADHEDLAAGIRGSRLEVFPDAGHGVFRDKPGEALELVREFVLGENGADPG